MEIKPPVAIALIVVVVLVIGFFAFKMFGPGGGLTTEKPPPMSFGLGNGKDLGPKSLGGNGPAGPAPMTPPTK